MEWDPVPKEYWSGDTETGGYRIVFQPVSDFPTSLQATPKQDVRGIEVIFERIGFFYIYKYSILYSIMNCILTIWITYKYKQYL